MKLEIKHIAPYLPYGLKIQTQDKNGILIKTVNGIYEQYKDGSFMLYWQENYGTIQASGNIKLILRPLSDLHNENNHHFEEIKRKYSCINISLDKEHPNMFVLNNEDVVSYHYLPYMVIRYLLKNHYDIFGLIENGLALSYNDL